MQIFKGTEMLLCDQSTADSQSCMKLNYSNGAHVLNLQLVQSLS